MSQIGDGKRKKKTKKQVSMKKVNNALRKAKNLSDNDLIKWLVERPDRKRKKKGVSKKKTTATRTGPVGYATTFSDPLTGLNGEERSAFYTKLWGQTKGESKELVVRLINQSEEKSDAKSAPAAQPPQIAADQPALILGPAHSPNPMLHGPPPQTPGTVSIRPRRPASSPRVPPQRIHVKPTTATTATQVTPGKTPHKVGEKLKTVALTKDVSVRVHADDAAVVAEGAKQVKKELKAADQALFTKSLTGESIKFRQRVQSEVERDLKRGPDGKALTASDGLRAYARKAGFNTDEKKYNSSTKQLAALLNPSLFPGIEAIKTKVIKEIINLFPLVKKHGEVAEYDDPDEALLMTDLGADPPAGEESHKDHKHSTATHPLTQSEIDMYESMDQGGTGKLNIAKDGMDTAQIDSIMASTPGYQCCVARNEGLPIVAAKGPNNRMSWIKNTDVTNAAGGSGGLHWLGILIDDNEANFYDPFGDPPDADIVVQIMKVAKPNVPFKINTVVMQDVRSSSCGPLSMMFLVNRQTKSFADATGFKQQKEARQGEHDVKEFEKTYPPFKSLSQHGKGLGEIFDRVKAFFSGPRVGLSPQIRKTLETYGGSRIVSITVCREPINSKVDSFLNVLTFGAYNSAKKDMQYDKFFHLYLFFKLERNSSFRLEKNAVITLTRDSTPGNVEKVEVPGVYAKDLDLIKFFEKGKQAMGGEPNFSRYDAFTQNCQDFILGMLRGSGLLTDTLKTFIKQDAAKLLEKLPRYTSWIAKAATGLAAAGDQLVNGKGLAAKIIAQTKPQKEKKPKKEKAPKESKDATSTPKERDPLTGLSGEQRSDYYTKLWTPTEPKKDDEKK